MFTLEYPERKTVTDQTIRDWYYDACANGEIGTYHLRAPDVKSMADALSDAGLITYSLCTYRTSN
jgi:hypothetical protein